MVMEVIHKLNITDESKFDIKECLNIKGFKWQALKKEVEEYITHQSKENKLPWWGYFRCKYYDEKSDSMLMLFIYKSCKLSIMQYWDLAGVCLAKDWTQELEDDGFIRSWLKVKIKDIPEQEDWVIRERVMKVLERTTKTKFEKVLKEVRDEFNNKRDQEVAEEMAFLQSYYFEFTGRRTRKKNQSNRKRTKLS